MIGRILILGCLLLGYSVPDGSASTPDDRERRFIWAEANTQMAAAQSAEEFRAAARTYWRLVQTGVRNGPLFYNAGLALLQAGEFELAARLLARAERYEGSTPEIRRNLELAFAGMHEGDSSAMPWTRLLFVWHFRLSVPLRVQLAAVFFSSLCLGILMGRLGKGNAGRTVTIVSVVLLAILGSSIAVSLEQESRDRNNEWRITQLTQEVHDHDRAVEDGDS